jgi:NAD(P)-dependent dehydrogenase (short-subunit alcohol dehydrogenase family)
VELELAKKVAVVTGAGKGIGMAVTRALADEGARVVAGSRSTASLEGLQNVSAMALDLSAADAPARLVQRALDEHGRVDILVNNVGAVRLRLDGFLATTDDDFAWAMNMNFFTTLRACRAVLTPMIEQGGGAIVNIASVNAFFEPDGGTIDYGAAKAAVLNLSKCQQSSAEGDPRQSCRGPVSTTCARHHGAAMTVAATEPMQMRPRVRRADRRLPASDPGRSATLSLLSGTHGQRTGANYVIDGGLIKTTETAERRRGLRRRAALHIPRSLLETGARRQDRQSRRNGEREACCRQGQVKTLTPPGPTRGRQHEDGPYASPRSKSRLALRE